MNKLNIPLLISALILSSLNIFSQGINEKNIVSYETGIKAAPLQKKFFITYSAGLETDSGKFTLFLGFKKSLGKAILLGLNGGIINNRRKAVDAVYDHISSFYSSLQPGSYQSNFQFYTKGMTWILDGTFDYKIFNNFYAGAGIGFIANKLQHYYTVYHFTKSFANQPLTVDNAGSVYAKGTTELSVRYHYKIDVNYNYKSILAGIYFDNIYSAGINFGIGF